MKRNEGEFKVIDGGTLQGQAVWKIEARFPKGGTFIKAKDDETLWDIGQRTGQDTWVIVTTNKDFDEPDDVDQGDKVFADAHLCVTRFHRKRQRLRHEFGAFIEIKGEMGQPQSAR